MMRGLSEIITNQRKSNYSTEYRSLKNLDKRDVKLKLYNLNKISLTSVTNPKILRDTIPYLINLIDDCDWRVRKNTVEILGNIGLVNYEMVEKYINNILKKLEDENPYVVRSTVYAIIKISINPKCRDRDKLIDIALKKISKNTRLYTGILKNISEIYPDIAKRYIGDILRFLEEDDPVIKINALKILRNIEDVKINRKIAQEIVKNLRGSPKLREYCTYIIWKLSKNNLEHFSDAIDPLIEIANLEKDNKIVMYSLLALNTLCHIDPKKFKKLDINTLLHNKNVRKPLLELLYNISLLDHSILVPYMDKLHEILNKEKNIWINRMIIRIIGNMGLYDRRYVERYLTTLYKKMRIAELRQDVVLTLIKGNYIDKNVLNIILRAFHNLNENVKFLEEIITYYPLDLLDSLYNEIKKLKPYLSKSKNFKKLLNIIEERSKEKDLIIIQKDIEIENNTEKEIEDNTEKNVPKIVVALESDCTKMKLEDNKKVYIIPENACVKIPFSDNLLNFLEKYGGDGIEVKELIVKLLIEDALLDHNRDKEDEE